MIAVINLNTNSIVEFDPENISAIDTNMHRINGNANVTGIEFKNSIDGIRYIRVALSVQELINIIFPNKNSVAA